MDSLAQDLEIVAALLPQLISAQHRQLAQELAAYGLTCSQFVTLTALEPCAEGCRMGPLAAEVLQSAASMTGIVDRLMERGLVERERHPQDRRAVVVRLTDKGSELLVRVKERRLQVGRTLLAALSPEERQHLRHLLTRLVELVEKSPDG